MRKGVFFIRRNNNFLCFIENNNDTEMIFESDVKTWLSKVFHLNLFHKYMNVKVNSEDDNNMILEKKK